VYALRVRAGADEIESLRSRLAAADREATVLVVAMADQFGAPDNWKPLPDAAGMITQISNMVAGLREERALIVQRAENAEAALVEADKDAERYRWLRDRAWPFEFNGDTPEDADAAIDAAMHLAARPAAAKKHTPECSYWDGLMAQVCNCGLTERCCVDYPRCDCNSPPEPDNAPTLQPCGHPWKAQHDFKCILCSSPG
jgi:hypothetical protein